MLLKEVVFVLQTLSDFFENGSYISDMTRIQCGKVCSEIKGCCSFFYKEDGMLCHTSSVRYSSSERLTPAQGYRYYIDDQCYADADPCSSHGTWTANDSSTGYCICNTGYTGDNCDTGRCPPHLGYKLNTSPLLCFKMVTEHKQWQDARRECQRDDGRPIILDTVEKDAFMRKFMRDNGHFLQHGAYIGGIKSADTGAWLWVDGTPISNFNWRPGEPKNYEYRLALKTDGWNDIKLHYNIPFVCEIVLNKN